MSFAVPAGSYDRYMGRYSRKLAPLFAEFAGVRPGMRALDVGCGPGALTESLAARAGADAVAAADPSESFVATCAERVPVDDAPGAVSEMRRVARSGGVVAACTWDYRERMEMLRVFWDAALAVDPDAPDEGGRMRFATTAELREQWLAAGVGDVTTDALEVGERYDGFDDYWQPFTAGVGPGGAYCVALEPERREALRDECRRRLGDPSGPFELRARAWAVRGVEHPSSP